MPKIANVVTVTGSPSADAVDCDDPVGMAHRANALPLPAEIAATAETAT